MPRRTPALLLGLTLLGACASGDGLEIGGLNITDTFRPARNFDTGQANVPDDPRLARILFNEPQAPGHQGLLHVAMVEAQVAAQYAGFALATNDLSDAKNAIGDVLFAIDPNSAPAWAAREAGIVQVWAGRGYGVRRAVSEIQEEMRAIAAARPASDAVGQNAAQVSACADTMLERASRIVGLGEQVLAAEALASLRPTLEQIERLALEVLSGTAERRGDRDASACGLQQARPLLHAMTAVAA